MEAAGAVAGRAQAGARQRPRGRVPRGLTRVRAGLEAPEDVEVRIESARRTARRSMVPFAAVHAHYTRAQAVTGCQSFDDQIYLAVADMLADPEHRAFIEAPLRPRPRRRVPGPQRRPARAGRRALAAAARPLRGGRRRPAHLRVAVRRPARHPRVPRAHAAARRGRPPTRCAPTTAARASVVESAARLVANNTVREDKDVRPRERRRGGRAALRRRARLAGARGGALRLPARRAARASGCAWRDLAVLCRYRSQQLAVALALDAGRHPAHAGARLQAVLAPGRRLLRAYIDLARAPDDAAGDAPAPAAQPAQPLPAQRRRRGRRRARRGRGQHAAGARRGRAGGRAAAPLGAGRTRSRELGGDARRPGRSSRPASSCGRWSTSSVSRTAGRDRRPRRRAATARMRTPVRRSSTPCWCSPRRSPTPRAYLAVWDRLLRRRRGRRRHGRRHAGARGRRRRPRGHRHDPRRQRARVRRRRHPRLRLRRHALGAWRHRGGAARRLRRGHPGRDSALLTVDTSRPYVTRSCVSWWRPRTPASTRRSGPG